MSGSPNQLPLSTEEDLMKDVLLEDQLIPVLSRMSVEQLQIVHRFVDKLQEESERRG
jgi:hypothetical protein